MLEIRVEGEHAARAGERKARDEEALHDAALHGGILDDEVLHGGSLRDGILDDEVLHGGILDDEVLHDGILDDEVLHDGILDDEVLHDGVLDGVVLRGWVWACIACSMTRYGRSGCKCDKPGSVESGTRLFRWDQAGP